MPETQTIRLVDLDFLPYLTPAGDLTPCPDGKIGVYAIFDADQQLQFVGYSRDVSVSLLQHLIRQPDRCHWFKAHCIDRPNRSVLEQLRTDWLAEAESHDSESDRWTQPIDAKVYMTDDERHQLDNSDGAQRPQLLKQIARRVEQQVVSALSQRGFSQKVRFNPKLKESGLLDLK
jgi:hypothetical protein